MTQALKPKAHEAAPVLPAPAHNAALHATALLEQQAFFPHLFTDSYASYVQAYPAKPAHILFNPQLKSSVWGMQSASIGGMAAGQGTWQAQPKSTSSSAAACDDADVDELLALCVG